MTILSGVNPQAILAIFAFAVVLAAGTVRGIVSRRAERRSRRLG